MATAGEVIKTALRKITVLGAEADIEAVDGQTGIEYLNDMMAELDATGIALGYTEVVSLGDLVTTPAGTIGAIKNILARKLWDEYSANDPLPASLAGQAASGIKILNLITKDIAPMQYPSTLPIGSGNEGSAVYDNYHFYPEPDATILAESGGSIALESETNNE